MRTLVAMTVLSMSLAHCSSSQPPPAPFCATDPRVETFSLGLQSKGPAGVSVAIVNATPSVVQQGLNEWTVRATDASGAPVDGTLAIASLMPDHNHGSPTLAVVTPKGQGQYDISGLNLSMRGVWQITIRITSPAVNDSATFTFCVDGAS